MAVNYDLFGEAKQKCQRLMLCHAPMTIDDSAGDPLVSALAHNMFSMKQSFIVVELASKVRICGIIGFSLFILM